MCVVHKGMSELSELMHSTRNENKVPGTITDISVYASFYTGFLGLDIYYETVEVQLEVETKFEPISLSTQVKNFFNSPISDVLLESLDTDNPQLQDLIDTNIYLDFDENFNRASIGTDMDFQYDSESNLIKGSSFVEDEGNVESRSYEFANTKLKNDFHIESEGKYGWVEAEFRYIGKISDKYVFEGKLETGTKLYWTFDSNIESLSEITSFLNNLGINHTTGEFDDESIWVKPICLLDHTNRNDTRLMLDSEERWTARQEPQRPGYSWLKRVMQKLKPSESISVSVESSSNQTNLANSSDRMSSFKDKVESGEIEIKDNKGKNLSKLLA